MVKSHHHISVFLRDSIINTVLKIQGDSGGPLQCNLRVGWNISAATIKNYHLFKRFFPSDLIFVKRGHNMLQDGRWYLAGITSFGSGCAKPGFPDVFVRVRFSVLLTHIFLYEYTIKGMLSNRSVSTRTGYKRC